MKIGIIGAGNVGATIAHILTMRSAGDIYMLDVNADLARGKAMDMNQSKFLFNSAIRIDGGDDYSQVLDADYIVITAGLARKPGMTRDDLLFKNLEIIKDVSQKIKAAHRNPFVIVVSNPLDIMAYAVQKVTGFPANRVLGMAGVLDSYRYMHYIERKLNLHTAAIEAMTLGSHGDTMVPLSSNARVEGKLLASLVPPHEIKVLEDRTKNGGAEIVGLLKTGSAYYAPAASTVRMMEAIILDENSTHACSVLAQGEYGLKDMYIGLPVKLGKSGCSRAIELSLSGSEKEQLDKSAASIREQLEKIKDKL